MALGLVVLVALSTWWAVGSIGSKARSDREHLLNELLAASAAATTNGDPGGAFREIEAALFEARKLDPEGSSRLDALIDRRNRAARAEVQARLAALAKKPIEAREGEALTLASRVRRDPALAALADSVSAAVEGALLAQAEADRDGARAAVQAGQGTEAYRLAGRAFDRAARLASRADVTRIQAEAQEVIVAAVERCGTTLVLGDSGIANSFVQSLWTEALARRGYLPQPTASPWSEIWTTHAPYQVSARVVEAQDGLYLQSNNRPTQIDAHFSIVCRGQPHWQTRIYSQTRSPLPDLPAYLAGHLATTDHRDPEIERRLREDAQAAFRALAERNFRGIPTPAATSSRPTS